MSGIMEGIINASLGLLSRLSLDMENQCSIASFPSHYYSTSILILNMTEIIDVFIGSFLTSSFTTAATQYCQN